MEVHSNPEIILPYAELKLNKFELQTEDIKLHETGKLLLPLKEEILSFSNFEEEFDQVFKHKELQQKKLELLKALSDEYLGNYPEYESRVKVLRELKYIDHEDRGMVEEFFAVVIQSFLFQHRITEFLAGHVFEKLK